MLFVVFGCNRCDDDVKPDLCTIKLDTSAKICNYIMDRPIGSIAPRPEKLFCIEIDSLRIPGDYMFKHFNDADSVKWLLEGEQKWRKGSQIKVRFERAYGSKFKIKKRVWGDRVTNCPNNKTNVFYESEHTYPIAIRKGFNPYPLGSFSGVETYSKKTVQIEFSLDTSLILSWGVLYIIKGLHPNWPKPNVDLLNQSTQEFYGDRLYRFVADSRSEHMQGYIYALTRDSVLIDYSYGDNKEQTQRIYQIKAKRI